MNRLSMAAIKARMATTAEVIAITGIKVGSSFDADYLDTFAKSLPGLWAVAQRQTPLDDGHGLSGIVRQYVRTELLVRAVVRRDPIDDTPYDAEAALDTVANAAVAALFGWTPPNCRSELVWSSSEDGPPWEGCLSIDLRFHTEKVYQRAST